MRFYLDEDLSPQIALALRARGIDALSAHEAGKLGIPDSEQLGFAAGLGRSLVTGNAVDFARLGRDAIRDQRPHSGIVLCPPRVRGSDIGPAARALARLAERYPDGLGDYDVVYL